MREGRDAGRHGLASERVGARKEGDKWKVETHFAQQKGICVISTWMSNNKTPVG